MSSDSHTESSDESREPVHVAVGVIVNSRRQVLVSLRHPDSHQGNLWEFPGGKPEPGEAVEAGLRREFREELGLEILRFFPLKKIAYCYADKSVLLDVFQITEFRGEARSLEGQAIEWRALDDLRVEDFPAANEPIIRTLQLPREIAITPSVATGEQLERVMSNILAEDPARDLKLIHFRQKLITPALYLRWFESALQRCRRRNTGLMFSQAAALLPQVEATGFHATTACLMALEQRPVGPEQLFSASCHSLAELRKAETLAADFVYLSPVRPTDKYGAGEELGWSKFEQLAAGVSLPVYAMGGLTRDDLPRALSCGAFGIAGISAYQARP